jgi:hypothetical protein
LDTQIDYLILISVEPINYNCQIKYYISLV